MMNQLRNIKLGKNSFLKILAFFILFAVCNFSNAESSSKSFDKSKFIDIKILDKVSSKTSKIQIQLGTEKKFKNLLIKALKCKNSEFDDNPEITAYIQVKDTSDKSNDEVFVFNGWMFSSSPSITPFDHPIYDVWLVKCY